MFPFSKSLNFRQQCSTWAVLAALGTAPIFGATTVQAQVEWPNRFPEDRDYSHDNHRYDDGDYDDHYDRNEDDNRDRQFTVTGIVTRGSSSDRFDVRTDDGHVFRVIAHDSDNFRVWSGARVEVRGHRDGNILVAHRVRMLSGSTYNGNRIDFSATIISLRSSTRMTVRGDNGRIYSVSMRNYLVTRANRGDRVRVIGTLSARGEVLADQVILLQDNQDSDGRGRYVSFPATVLSIQSNSNLMRVRGDNDRVYVVRSSDVDRFARNERIQVIGTYEQGIITATRIRRL